MKKILILSRLNEEAQQIILRAAEGAQVVFAMDERPTAETVADADMIVGPLPVSLIPAAKKLKVLQLQSAGADPYIKPGVLPEDVDLCNATGAYGLAVAEHLFAGILSVMKKLHQYRDNQNKNVWQGMGLVGTMLDATVLIIGPGDIGGTLANMCRALGAYVICVRRTKAPKPDFADEMYTIDELDTVLPRADVVAMAVPGAPETVHLLSRERIAMLKPGVIVANGGRGSAIDQTALYEAARDGRVGYAFLDVTTPEPLPADDPLWSLQNVFITPHVAGGFNMLETQRRIAGVAAKNIRHFLAGEKRENIVDKTTGYKRSEASE
jgi:phosphoglycerate dehydrogenase-like enzyme